MQTGLTFEQLQLGDSSTFTKTITEADVVLFAGLSGDFNPYHVDEVFAETSVYGRRIAHGMLTMSLLTNVLGNRFPGKGTVILGLQCRFVAPVYFGDTITVQATVTEKRVERGMVAIWAKFFNQDGKLVCTGNTTVLPPRITVRPVARESALTLIS